VLFRVLRTYCFMAIFTTCCQDASIYSSVDEEMIDSSEYGEYYSYIWSDYYQSDPTDISGQMWYCIFSDHAVFGYDVRDGLYVYHYYDDADGQVESCDVVTCPGPFLPPLQGPPPPTAHVGDYAYEARSHSAFVYDEQAELQLRDQRSAYRFQHLTPGYYFREF